MGSSIVRVEGLSKRYVARVLDGITFDVRPGEVHALVGENGAGKSTLSRIICGLTPASSGTMYFRDQPYTPSSKKDADHIGIHMVMQELNLIPTLSVAENLFLNHLPRRFGFVNYKKLHQMARHLLSRIGLKGVKPDKPVGDLGIGHQQMVEIAANLAGNCKLLILDEPTAMLTNREVDLLFEQIDQLKKQGVGIVFISHRLEEVQRISDRISVLRDGQMVGTHKTDEIDLNGIVSLMVGRKMDETVSASKRELGDTILEVKSLQRRPFVKNVSFKLKTGEILGFAGLVGSGRTEMLRLIFGADKKESGEIFLRGSSDKARINSPRDAVGNGVAMISEDRKEEGLLLTQSISVNTTLAKIKGVSSYGWIGHKKENRVAEQFGKKMSLKATSMMQKVDQLSGGNQQKVVIGRWLYPKCDILLFDEPTRGIDVGAKFDIYRLLEGLAKERKSIVIVSSDLRELMMICDRIAVMSDGKLVETFDKGNWDQESILAAAFSEYLISDSA